METQAQWDWEVGNRTKETVWWWGNSKKQGSEWATDFTVQKAAESFQIVTVSGRASSFTACQHNVSNPVSLATLISAHLKRKGYNSAIKPLGKKAGQGKIAEPRWEQDISEAGESGAFRWECGFTFAKHNETVISWCSLTETLQGLLV